MAPSCFSAWRRHFWELFNCREWWCFPGNMKDTPFLRVAGFGVRNSSPEQQRRKAHCQDYLLRILFRPEPDKGLRSYRRNERGKFYLILCLEYESHVSIWADLLHNQECYPVLHCFPSDYLLRIIYLSNSGGDDLQMNLKRSRKKYLNDIIT